MKKHLLLLLLFIFLGISLAIASNNVFKEKQLTFKRVRTAQTFSADQAASLFQSKGLEFPNNNIFIRILKFEEVLELWSFHSKKDKYVKVKEYEICAASGNLGPKRQQGELQVPEGFYHINLFNPNSKYHLSMQINYPNKLDLRQTTNPDNPGNLIFIHGGCASIGCVAIGDEGIEELYWIALEAKNAGQSKIPVHIFPCHMKSLRFKIKRYLERDNPSLLNFWANVKTGFDYFEKHKQLPSISVNNGEEYIIQ